MKVIKLGESEFEALVKRVEELNNSLNYANELRVFLGGALMVSDFDDLAFETRNADYVTDRLRASVNAFEAILIRAEDE